MEKTELVKEPAYRVNFKQTAKGDVYGECTVRGDDMNEVKKQALELLEFVQSRSTVGGQ